jgi:translation initiation factor IF-2
VVAVNKIDLPTANPDRIKQQLSELQVMPEEWGGDVPFVEVSAKERLGLDDLIEVLLLVADVNELRANALVQGEGAVIEARIDPNRGPVATLLVQNGTLNMRDVVVAGTTWGRVKAMFASWRFRKPAIRSSRSRTRSQPDSLPSSVPHRSVSRA